MHIRKSNSILDDAGIFYLSITLRSLLHHLTYVLNSTYGTICTKIKMMILVSFRLSGGGKWYSFHFISFHFISFHFISFQLSCIQPLRNLLKNLHPLPSKRSPHTHSSSAHALHPPIPICILHAPNPNDFQRFHIFKFTRV